MAVRCEGDSWVMEQLGEKQDFECELTRLGFRHEDFALSVRHASAPRTGTASPSNYAVSVTNMHTGKHMIYWGGPGQRWVEVFGADVAHGAYGSPANRRSPPPVSGRHAV